MSLYDEIRHAKEPDTVWTACYITDKHWFELKDKFIAWIHSDRQMSGELAKEICYAIDGAAIEAMLRRRERES